MPVTMLPARSEVDESFTWDLSSLFATDKDYLVELAAVPAAIEDLGGFRGRLGTSATLLGDFFEQLWDTSVRLRKLANYSSLPVTVDQTDQAARARAGRFQALAAQYDAATAYVAPELLELGQARLTELIGADPRLTHLHRYIELLEKRRPHVRSGEVESVLSAANDPLSAGERAYNSLTNGEIPFTTVMHAGAEHEVARSTYPKLRMAADRELR